MASPVILIYGFEPFRRYRRNITQLLVEALPTRPKWHRVVLPVRFEAELFLPLVEQLQPNYMLGLGQCPRGRLIRIERRAYNLMRQNKADAGVPIVPGEPEYLLPNWRIAPTGRMRHSYDAGRYVCNYSMYLLGGYAAAQGCRYAFLHVPRQFSVRAGVREIVRLLEKLE